MATVPRDSCIRFGRFTMQLQNRSLLLDDAPAPLGSRAFDLLAALATHPGEVLDKRTLLEIVWPGVVVEDNNLQVQICALRKLLGPQAIVTLPGRGYAFAAMPSSGAEGVDPAGAVDRADAAAMPLRGREAEVLALHELLGAQRMTTIVGPGGVGKTRLASAAVPAHQHRFTAGVWHVDLARVAPGAPIAPEVVRAMRLSRRGGIAPSLPQLGRLLPNQPVLIVLENCEHVIGEVGALAHDVLQHLPLVQLLLTSQVPSKVRGEHVLRLDPLEVPAFPEREALRQPAVALFFDNVEAAGHPTVTPDADDVEDAVAICRHLDGIPLAIELAATRVPVLGIQGVRSRLGDRFRMLTSTSRTGAARERSLLASLQWSWGLLTAQEKAVLTAVARFKGHFTIRMAMQALQPAALTEWQAMDLLGALCDKSMVTTAPGRRAAFRLLESTRMFVQDLASTSGGAQAAMQPATES